MKNQLSWDRFYMGIAEKAAELSYEDERKVGCVIVKDGNILSFSYNGTPPGTSNIMRDADGRTLPLVLHAETNAIAKVAQSHESTKGATVYTTYSPCMECAKAIYQAGIERVVFGDLYKMPPLDFLLSHGVTVKGLYGHHTLSFDPGLAGAGSVPNIAAI